MRRTGVCQRARHADCPEQGFDLPRFYLIGPGEERRVCGFTVRAYAGCHCLFDRPIVRETLRRSLRPEHLREGISIEKLNRRFRIDLYRDVLAYEIERGGKRLFLLGSANCRKNVAYPKQIDLMVYPYQGRSDMLAYSLRFLKRLRRAASCSTTSTTPSRRFPAGWIARRLSGRPPGACRVWTSSRPSSRSSMRCDAIEQQPPGSCRTAFVFFTESCGMVEIKGNPSPCQVRD